MKAAADTLELDVSYAARRPWAPRRAQFLRWAAAALGRAPRSAVLSIRIVGTARSRSLNERYRGKAHATNVLSFTGAGSLPDGREFLGELVICAPVVAREARAQSKTPDEHWAHMTVHGVLHLLGYDHERAAEARKMARIEIQILDRLGFSNPYA
ncbi:MAG TPA: rRNA maturation RNase YbeY [Steroidobacteraceae bacterium]|nr:rRNA maturation RNase YbeY [Steroidobacteraceae bacterium]